MVALAIAAATAPINPIALAVIGIGSAIAGIWYLWDRGAKKTKKLETSLYNLEETTNRTRATPTRQNNTERPRVTPIRQNNTGRTERAREGMTQNTVNYAQSTVAPAGQRGLKPGDTINIKTQNGTFETVVEQTTKPLINKTVPSIINQ